MAEDRFSLSQWLLGRLSGRKPATQEELEEMELMREIDDMQMRLKSAHSRFDFVSDEDMVESCIYEIESLESRYQHLIRRAKEKKRMAGKAITA